MGTKNGRTKAVIEWVTQHPGRKAREIGAALNFDHKTGLLSWMVRLGLLHKSGPKKGSSFYADAEQAAREHDANCRRFEEQSRRRAELTRVRSQTNRRARRHSNGVKPRDTRPADTRFRIDPGVRILPGVKITIAPKPKDRFAPDPGFERVITSDWMLRRQGVDPMDVIDAR